MTIILKNERAPPKVANKEIQDFETPKGMGLHQADGL